LNMDHGLLGTFALNAPLIPGAYWVARHGFRQPPGLPRCLASVVLGWTWVTVGLEFLGSLGFLQFAPLLAWAVAGLLIGLGCRLRARPIEPEASHEARESGWAWESVVALGLTFSGALFHGVQSLLGPVKVISDGPIYHLYFAARWWKEGGLNLIATPFGENAAPYFPAVGDLWFTWLMVGWGGDQFAKVGQAPFWFVSALAAHGLARKLGASSSSALLAVTWFLTSTPLLLFAFEANVDMIFVAGYLLACFFFVGYLLGDTRRSTLALGALAAGGALGTKTIAIIFVPVLLASFSLAIGWPRRTSPWKERVARVALVWILPMVMAGFWFGRNLVLTGNPLYPLHLKVFGHVWLSGWYDANAMKQSGYYLPVEDWRSLVDVVLAVFDPHMAPVWLAAILGFWSIGQSKGGRERLVFVLGGLALVNIGLYWFLIPYRTQQRFMLTAVGLATVPLARLFDRARLIRILGLGLLVMHVLISQNWPFEVGSAPWDLSLRIPDVRSGIFFWPSFALVRQDGTFERTQVALVAMSVLGAGALAVAWTLSRYFARPTPLRLGVSCGTCLFTLAWAGLSFYPRDLDTRAQFYPPFPDYYAAWLDLEGRVGPSGVRIAYAGTNIPFYLMGAGLRNDVRYLNVDGRASWLLHDYHREARAKGEGTWPDPRPGWDRLEPNFQAWLRLLHEEGIQLLVVARANSAEGAHLPADLEGFPIERTWAETHPESFSPLNGSLPADSRMRIYRVIPPTRDAP